MMPPNAKARMAQRENCHSRANEFLRQLSAARPIPATASRLTVQESPIWLRLEDETQLGKILIKRRLVS